MIARQWKAKCPIKYKESFLLYLKETGVNDTNKITGNKGSEILTRQINNEIEIILITYWDSIESIETYAGNDISIAKLYPEDEKYDLKPDLFVTHYEVEYKDSSI